MSQIQMIFIYLIGALVVGCPIALVLLLRGIGKDIEDIRNKVDGINSSLEDKSFKA